MVNYNANGDDNFCKNCTRVVIVKKFFGNKWYCDSPIGHTRQPAVYDYITGKLIKSSYVEESNLIPCKKARGCLKCCPFYIDKHDAVLHPNVPTTIMKV